MYKKYVEDLKYVVEKRGTKSFLYFTFTYKEAIELYLGYLIALDQKIMTQYINKFLQTIEPHYLLHVGTCLGKEEHNEKVIFFDCSDYNNTISHAVDAELFPSTLWKEEEHGSWIVQPTEQTTIHTVIDQSPNAEEIAQSKYIAMDRTTGVIWRLAGFQVTRLSPFHLAAVLGVSDSEVAFNNAIKAHFLYLDWLIDNGKLKPIHVNSTIPGIEMPKKRQRKS